MNKETYENINKLQELINNDKNCANCRYSVIYNGKCGLTMICKIHDSYISDITPCLDYKF